MRAGDGCAGCRPADSLQMGLLLAATGGFLDAYTYVARGRVFANAQTGNLVLLGLRAFEADPQALRYLVPVCAFVLGIVLSEFLKARKRALHPVNWRQAVLGVEALVLVAAAFLPEAWNNLVNAGISFACAMQVQAFRKVNGYAFASTMCIGDLRSGVEAFCIWRKTHEPRAKDRMVRYFGIIFLFALGAGLGSKSAAQLGGRAIWISCCFLLVSFALMFIREELEENPIIEKDLTAIRQETREIDRTLKQELQEEQRELTQSTRK